LVKELSDDGGDSASEVGNSPFKGPTPEQLASMAKRRKERAQLQEEMEAQTVAALPNPGADAKAFGLSQGVSRNQPCPCGSGRKFKKCCMKTAEIDGVSP